MDIGPCWGISSGDLFDYFGARFDSGYSSVTVYDENSNPVWNCNLDKADLVTQGVGFLEGPQHFDSKTLPDEVEYYATLVDEESGVYINSGFWLLDEFDPKKLTFEYYRYEGNMYINGFFYDGREIQCIGNNSCGGGPEFTFIKR